VRLWKELARVSGQEAWLAAYTRETSAVLSVTNHKFIHHVDRNLDEGVNMLVRDLTLAGCVKSVRLLPRPELRDTVMNATGDEMFTDGTLTVVQLGNCDRPALEAAHGSPLIPVRPRSRFARYLRTQVLLYKSDVVRGNIVYGAFDLTRMGIHALRYRHRHPQDDEDDDGLPLSPVSPDTLFPQISFAGGSGL